MNIVFSCWNLPDTFRVNIATRAPGRSKMSLTSYHLDNDFVYCWGVIYRFSMNIWLEVHFLCWLGNRAATYSIPCGWLWCINVIKYAVFYYRNVYAIFLKIKKKYQFQFIYYTAKGRRCGANITNLKILLMRLTDNKYKMSYEAPFYYLLHIHCIFISKFHSLISRNRFYYQKIFFYSKIISWYRKIEFFISKIGLIFLYKIIRLIFYIKNKPIWNK